MSAGPAPGGASNGTSTGLWLRQIGAIVWKDLLLELRTRERLAAMGAFSVLVGVLFNFAFDPTIVRPRMVAAGLIWMTIVFAGILGIGRTFQLEAEDGALHGILLSPVSEDAVYFGKVIANFVLVLLTVLLVMAVFGIFFGLDYGRSPLALLAVLVLGTLGFVALGTLFAAVSAATTMGETLLPVLLFPVLLPVVIYGAGATGRLLAGRPPSEVETSLRMLAAFALLALLAGGVLFRHVVEE